MKPNNPEWDHPNCLKCGLCNGTNSEPLSNPFMSLHWNSKYRTKHTVLIIGDSPGGNEDLRGRPFVGKAGTILREQLIENGIDPRECAWTNSVRCRPPKNKISSQVPVKMCHDFLVQDIEEVRPTWILILGGTALKSVLKLNGIKKQRRHVFTYTLLDGKKVTCIPALHPASTLHDQNLKESFEGDIKYACQVIHGNLPEVKTYDVNIDATAEQIHRFHDELLEMKFPVVTCDLETNSKKPYLCPDFKVFCASLSNGKRALVAKLDEKTEAHTKLTSKPVFEAWKSIITDPRIAKVNHYVKYDMNATWVRFGFDWENVYCDTQTLDFYLKPINIGHDLETVAATMLNLGDFKSETNDAIKDTAQIYAMPYENLANRCGMDAIAAFQIFRKQCKLLKERPEREQNTFWNLVMPSHIALYRMEKVGVCVDTEHLDRLEELLTRQIDEVVQKLRKYPTVKAFKNHNLSLLDQDKLKAYRKWKKDGGDDRERPKKLVTASFIKEVEACSFRPSASQSVAALLFGAVSPKDLLDDSYVEPPNFGCPFNEKSDLTAGGKFSTDDGLLSRMQEGEIGESDPELKSLLTDYLEFKSLQKRLSTYVAGLRKSIDKNYRVHTTFNVNRADTGRNSSSDPNMQNQPRDAEQRNIFIASPGKVLVAADYSQLELRVLAAYCKDEALIRNFLEGKDMHSATARRVYGIPENEEVPSAMRSNSKSTNFGVVYGQSPYGLANKLNITEEEAQDLIDGLFAMFPGIEDWQNSVRIFARKNGYVTTMFGTRRLIENARLEGASFDERKQKDHAMRQAVNAPIQGSASHIKNAAMIEMDRLIRKKKMPVDLILEVHDDITAEMKPDVVDEYIAMTHRIMTTAHLNWIAKEWGDVPLEVEIKTGKRWGDMQKVKL